MTVEMGRDETIDIISKLTNDESTIHTHTHTCVKGNFMSHITVCMDYYILIVSISKRTLSMNQLP
jgi:hypothetical protein